MAAIPGSVRVAGFIAPTDSTDTYAVTDEQYNRGGYRSVATLADRDAITADRRKLGMLVYVIAADQYFTLKAGITNADWVQWAPVGSGGTAVQTFTKLNGETSAILKGMAVYITLANGAECKKAQANDYEKSAVVGLVTNTVANPGEVVEITTKGVVEKITPEWDILTSATGGLVAGRDYFLRSDFPGGITSTPPVGDNLFVVKVGKALSPTMIDVNVEPPIQL